MSNLFFIPSHQLEPVDNYNKEKLIPTNKITPTTGINETVIVPLLKLYMYIYIYIYIYLKNILLDKKLKVADFEQPVFHSFPSFRGCGQLQ